MRFCARLEKAVNSLWKVKMASLLLILTQSDKRTKLDKGGLLSRGWKTSHGHLSPARCIYEIFVVLSLALVTDTLENQSKT